MPTAVFAADFDKFYGAVTKAEVTLTNFESKTGKVESSLKRMTDSFAGTKIIQEATVAAEAVGRIGGAAKLTEQELAKVSSLASEAATKLRAMGQDVPDGIAKLAAAGQKTTSVFADLEGQIKATALGFVSAQAIVGAVSGGFRALTGFVSDSVESYSAAEAAAKKMTVALEAQGEATPETIKAFDDLATQFQKTTKYSDDLINEMEALLTQVGDVAPAQMKAALTASTNLASGLGIDLKDATMLVAKAFAKGGEDIGRLKSVLGEAYKPGMDMAQVLDVINSKFGGQAAAEAETYAGKMKQLANEWDNVKEAVGKNIATDPLVKAFLRGATEEATRAAESLEKGEEGWAGWVASIERTFSPTQRAIDQMRELADAQNTIAEATARMNAVPPPKEFTGGTTVASQFKDLDAAAQAFFDKTVAGWMKDDEAAKAFAKTLEESMKKWSGAAVQEDIKVLDITFRALADSGKITEAQVRAIATEAAKLSIEGGKLTPRLWAIVESTDALETSMKPLPLNFGALGTSVDLVIPKLDAFNQAVLDLQAKTKMGDWDVVANIGFKVSDGFKEGAKAIDDFNKQLGQLGNEIARAFSGVFEGGGGGFTQGLKNLGTSFAKDFVSGFLGAVPIVGPLLEKLGGPIVDGIKALFGSRGRDLVKDFASSMGGFDALRDKLSALGDEGERLWIALTQGVGKNNPEQAKKAIDDVTEALAKQKSKAEEAAKEAEQNAAARVKAEQDAVDAITASYAKTIEKLDSEYKSLSDSVSQEAEEAEMGITETKQRERMKQIEAEKKAAEEQRDKEIAEKKSTFENWVEDAKTTREKLGKIFGETLDIPYRFVPEGTAPDGGGATYSPPPPRAGRGGGGSDGGAGASSRSSSMTQIFLDGQVITTAVAKNLPTVLKQRGVG